MIRRGLIISALMSAAAIVAASALASPPPPATSPVTKVLPAQKSPEVIAAGKAAFVDVARVLQSPRCQNCHPAGDAPLQTDHGVRHAQNITRLGTDAGLACTTCHQGHNSEAVGVPNGPPGAPDWKLPPDDMPMVFEGKTLRVLCEQEKNPETNGHKTLDELVDHVENAPLVLWAWQPGGKRTLPPLTHAQFVAAFRTWVASGGACP